MAGVLLLVAGGGAWWYFYGPKDTEPEHAGAKGIGNNPGRPGAGGNKGGGEMVGPPTASAAQKAEALRFYKTGLQQLDGKKPFEARRYLSLAVLSGLLPPADDHSAVLALTDLANKYVLSPRIDPLDEYAAEYIVLAGDRMANLPRKLKLLVPWQCMMVISDGALTDLVHQRKAIDLASIEKKAARIRAGQHLKTINGAFHATIYKSRHVMDIYLHRPGGDKIFVRRIPVALGKHGCTPTGTWEVASRMYHPPYTPGPNSPLWKLKAMEGRSHIAYGEEHYAFGAKGLWIALRGTGVETRTRTGYGIHSTNEPQTIGTDASEGCIRVGDDDIELVYCLLQVTKAESENKASIIDIRD